MKRLILIALLLAVLALVLWALLNVLDILTWPG